MIDENEAGALGQQGSRLSTGNESRTDCVSVVVPAKNASAYLSVAIKSLLDQTIPPQEILVVDDGSTDNTTQIATSFGPPVLLLSTKGAKGASAARNTGIRGASCEFVAFLDADDICRPERIERHLVSFRQSPRAALSFVDVVYVDSTGSELGPPVAYEEFSQESFSGQLFVRNRIITTSAVMVRRSVLLEMNGFDEEISHNEEYDLWLRIALRYPVAHVASALVLYRLHATNISRDREKQLENEIKALCKHSLETIRTALSAAYPDAVQCNLHFAQLLFRMREISRCRDVLAGTKPTLDLMPLHRFYLGNAALAEGLWEEAKVHYDDCLCADPDFAPAWNNMGVSLARLGQIERAMLFFEKAAGLKNNYHDPLANAERLRRGQYDQIHPTFATLRPVLKPAINTPVYPK